jgi:ATP-dependent helicase/nuclease subunit A
VVSDRGKLIVPSTTKRYQAQAADPRRSIWVGANAGSGKTFVLTQRVLRLLLTGVNPQSILCLTYTKAAAAEMRSRVAKSLAEWAVMPQGELTRVLRDIEGSRVDDALIERARTLFARALETPGGLKIVTIHAFCESVLHRFPLEAGVPFDFEVIEDDERATLIRAAREAVLAEGLRGDAGASAVETLFDRLSNFQIEEAIDIALGDTRRLKAVLGDTDRAKARLRTLVGVGTTDSASLRRQLSSESLISADLLREIVRVFGGVPGGRRFVDLLAKIDPARMGVQQLRTAFITNEGKPRGLLNATQKGQRPDLQALLEAEQSRIVAIIDAMGKAELVERSDALLDVVAAIVARYESGKRMRSRLDFDDLVERLGALFERPEAGAWVRYKLDSGIDHILVDESQDTNPEQWRVVRAIGDEFFANAAGASRPRSLFAVGDQKQSIYSFQGAEPILFDETGRAFAKAAQAVGMPFERVPLHTSFRTLPEILAAVDLVAGLPDMPAALLETEPVIHEAARVQVGGRVTLWPPVQQAATPTGLGAWPTEPAAGGVEQTAARQVAGRIAREIRGWIDSKRPLASRGRTIEPRDVMVLVQSRGAVFQEVIRALRKENLPTPGADRLDVATHIAVLDLLALCDVLLNPADDLQLAALLRSPLFDISEDDLYALAQPRGQYQTLWEALKETTLPQGRDAYARLARWRKELDFERPFEFLSHVLYADGGLRRFHGRLGEEVDDVLAELLELALKHEQSEQPSLQGFVAAMRQTEISIKRELSETGNGVRVMTVHGAKGLEAPIVILADAASKPQGRLVNKPVYVLDRAPGPLLVHASGRSQHTPDSLPVRDAVEAALLQEYWRKLYVAMTRAEDELYVTGALTQIGKIDGTWYEKIDTALRPQAERVTSEADEETALIFPAERPLPQPVSKLTPSTAPRPVPLALGPVPAPIRPRILTPSTVGSHGRRGGALDTAAEQIRDADAARREGIALHALLQHLPALPAGARLDAALAALTVLMPEEKTGHAGLAAKAISILSRADLAALFGADSRAEVPFLVDMIRDGEDIRLAGRIDRLVIDDSGVLVVDYKSDASVPGGPGDVPGNYLTQLGLYALVAGQLFPGRTVRAAILWTRLESLMFLPSDVLAAGARGFTMR